MYDTIEEAGQKILSACRELKEAGLLVRTWGNISARLSEDEFLITPSGKGYDDMTPNELVKVGIRDLKWEGDLKPSSEKAMHAALYKQRKDAAFIVHTHQINASAVSVLREDLDLSQLPDEFQEQKNRLGLLVPCAGYGLSSTKMLADKVAKAALKNPQAPAILMCCHGAVCIAASQEEALQTAYDLEKAAGAVYEKKCNEKLARESGEEASFRFSGDYCLHVRTPFVMEMSRRGRTVLPYLDDTAQIIGLSIRAVDQGAPMKAIRKAAEGRNAVLIKGDGALCFGKTRDEAEAAALVLEKNCVAANLALKKAAPPVGKVSAAVERAFYVRKYSKLKNDEE